MNRLFRARFDRILFGVCGGIGSYLRVDSTVIRFLAIVLTIFTFFVPLILAYLVAAMIIPLEPTGRPRIERRELYRSNSNRMIAGLCGGLAEMLVVDPTMVRLASVFLCFLTGVIPLVLIYLIGWVIVPRSPR